MSEIKKSCFVIMPFSKTTEKRTEQYWTDHYENFLKPIIENESNVFVERSNPVRGDIIVDIISKLISSDIIIADLTDANANVYWELGVRQSFKHGTITIAEKGTKLPFDISGKGTLFYETENHTKYVDFSNQLINSINDCITNPDRPDSRVLETITGRGSFYEILNKEEANRKLTALINEYNYNKDTYSSLIDRVRKNQSATSKTYSTQLFRLSAIELLITTRYINTDNVFYKTCEKYFDHINSINLRIQMWPSRVDSVERWLLKTLDFDKAMIPFKNKVKAIISLKK